MTDEKLASLDALELCVQRVTKRLAEMPDKVKAARKSGASWTAIGKVLGVSRQAAWERYRHIDDELTRERGA